MARSGSGRQRIWWVLVRWEGLGHALIGLLFLAPWLGAAVGAISGAIAAKMSDFGVHDNFIKEVGNSIQPGNSALFLLVREATV
jgi:uncharacterized membrane protein